MSLKAANKVETNKYELEITASKEEFAEARKKAYKKNIGKMNVPGFRKGKAPQTFVEKFYGKEVFYEEAVNSLYPELYSKAVEESGIDPVDRADVDIVSIDENGFEFKATVFVKPEVSIKDYKGINATKKEYTVTEEEINSELDRVANRNSRLVTVTDRAVKDGDETVIDFEGFVDDVAFEGGKGDNYSLKIGSGSFIPGFEEQVIGHEIGETFDVNVKFPDDYHAEALKGKDARFAVTVHEIKAREMPLIDDEFAKEVSDFDTLEEYKKDLTEKLQKSGDSRMNEEFENELVDKVIEQLEAEIPEVMISNKIDEMVNDFAQRMQRQGLQLEQYLQYTNSDMATFRKTFEEQAAKQVKIRLALEKIAELEKIEPSADDIEEEYKKIAESYNIEVDQVKTFIPEKELIKDIAVNKAIDLVRDSAVVSK